MLGFLGPGGGCGSLEGGEIWKGTVRTADDAGAERVVDSSSCDDGDCPSCDVVVVLGRVDVTMTVAVRENCDAQSDGFGGKREMNTEEQVKL